MSVWDDMARDAGARGEEAREMAAWIEEEERRRSEHPCRGMDGVIRCPKCGQSSPCDDYGPGCP